MYHAVLPWPYMKSQYYALDIFIPNQKSQWVYLKCHVYLRINWNTSPLIHIFERIFSCGSCDTLLSIVARLWTEWTKFGVARTRYSLVQPPIQWIPGVKQLGCESNHFATPSAKVKKAWNSTSNPLYVLKL